MNGTGLWQLFCRTGLPEAYLALRARERELPQPARRAVSPARRAARALSGGG